MRANLISKYIYYALVTGNLCYGQDTKASTTNTDLLEEKIRSLEVQVHSLQKLVQGQTASRYTTVGSIQKDCSEIYENGTRTDGVYSISPDGNCPFSVYCDMTNGGWTLIQKRVDDNVNFHRSWDDYVSGFGDINGSHWLGLEKIHRLTQGGSQIYFDMENYDGTKDYAHYKVFTVLEAKTAYTMNVDSFNYRGSIAEIFSYHNNMKFSTYDRDNDAAPYSCVWYSDGGGWWYNSCYRLGNMNGVYGKRDYGGIGYFHTSFIPIKDVVIKVKNVPGHC